MWTQRLKAISPYVRRMAAHGFPADDIARLYRINREEARFVLSRPPRPPVPQGPDRKIRGHLGRDVRRLLGRHIPPDSIARELDLAELAVCDFIARLTPRTGHRDRRGSCLNRPRSAREQAALREWDRSSPGAEVGIRLEIPPQRPEEPALPIEPETWEEGPIDPRLHRESPNRRGKAKAKKRRMPRARDTDARVKLTAADRAEIRKLAREGWGPRRLAKRYGVHRQTIMRLLRGERWAGEARPIPPRAQDRTIGQRLTASSPGPDPQPDKAERTVPVPPHAKLADPAIRAEIRRLSREGWGQKRLARRFGVHAVAISRLLSGRTYADDPDAPAAPPRPKRWRERAGMDGRARGDDAGDGPVIFEVPGEAGVPGPAAKLAEALDDDQAEASCGDEREGPVGPTAAEGPHGPNHRHKLDARLDDIRRWRAGGASLRECGRRLGVSHMTIRDALRRAGALPSPAPS